MRRNLRSPRQQQCSMEQLNLPHCSNALSRERTGSGGSFGTCSPHRRGAHLQFPPPPNYPPPYPSTSKMSEEHSQSTPGPSWDIPNDYSYAYYVPGPPTRHTNVPSKYPGTYREGSYRTRHTYLTRYGTEENIYEEISEVARARLRPSRHHTVRPLYFLITQITTSCPIVSTICFDGN